MRNPIWRYIIKRLLMAVPLILGAVTVTFIIIQHAPGDPIDVHLGEFPASPEYVAQLRAELGRDKSGLEQYVAYVGALARGNLGYSFRNRRSVAELILERLPATLLLMGSAIVLASAMGVGLGVAASLRPHSAVDNVSSVLAIVGSWNSFLLPLIIFNDPTWYTLPLGLQRFQETQYSNDTAGVLAYVILSMLPALAFYAVAERQLIGGLTTGVTRN